jgi:hypothetical protein
MAEDNGTVGMEPLHVTIMGGTGDGGVRQQTIVTPAGQQNVIATFIPTTYGLVLGWIDSFIKSFLSISGIGAVANIDALKAILPNHSALGGTVIEEAIFYAFVIATFGLLADIGKIVSKLREKYPLFGV